MIMVLGREGEAENELQRGSFHEMPVDKHCIGQGGSQWVEGRQIALLFEVRVNAQSRALARQAECPRKKKITLVDKLLCFPA